MEKKTIRFEALDAAKALAMFAVILGHTVNRYNGLFRFIFAFHMPAFFFFSGYCTKEDFTDRTGFGDYLKKKAKSLLIPFVIFCIYGLVLAVLFPDDWWNSYGLSYNLERYFYQALPVSGGSVWFLVCLFFSSLMSYGAVRVSRFSRHSDAVLLAEISAFAFIGAYLLPKLNVPYHGRLPWKIDTAVTASVFQISGYLTAKKKLLVRIPGAVKITGLFVLPVIVYIAAVLLNGYVNICELIFGDPFLFYLAAFAGILWLLDLGFLLRNVSLLQWLGRNTLIIFATHTFPLWICTEIYSGFSGFHSYHVPVSVWAFLIAFFVYAVCACFVFFWNKTVLHRMVRRLMS